MGTFAEDVVVQPGRAGGYAATLDHSWDLFPLPQGGIVVALALRAMAAELGLDIQPLRTCTTVFAGQVSAGDIHIDVRTLRRGRSATQLVATVRNDDAEAGATTIAVFGGARRGPSFVDVTAPVVPPPAQCRSYRDAPPPGIPAFPPTPFWTRVEGRAALGHDPWDTFEPETSDVATWLRFDDAPLLADGTLDPLAVVALADRMPGAISERIGYTGEPWFAPSADLTVHLFAPVRTTWLLAHDRARWANDGWASAETTLWDENQTLVGYATQMMFFTYAPT